MREVNSTPRTNSCSDFCMRWINKVWSTTVNTFNFCVSPRRFTLLLQLGLPHRSPVCSSLRPPLVPRLMDGVGADGPDWTKTGELDISWHIWLWTKAWKSQLDVNLRLCWWTSNTFIFTSSHTDFIRYLFVITDPITQGNSDSCTFTYCRHWTPPRACFLRLSLTSHIMVHISST